MTIVDFTRAMRWKLYLCAALFALAGCTIYFHDGQLHIVTHFKAVPLAELLADLAEHQADYHCYFSEQGISVFAKPPASCPPQNWLERDTELALCVLMEPDGVRLQGTVIFYVPSPVDCAFDAPNASGCLVTRERTAVVLAGPAGPPAEVTVAMLMSGDLTALHRDRLGLEGGFGDAPFDGVYDTCR